MTALLLLLAIASPDHDSLFVVAPAETLHVSIAGEGETLILIPGLLGAGYGFRKLTPLLNGAGYRTVVVDLLGTGRSSRPRGADYTLEAQATRVGDVLDALGVEHAHVIAHAIGGSVALRLALQRPALVRSVLLLEGGPAEAATTPGLRSGLKLAPLIRLLGVGTVRGRVRGQMQAASGDPSWVEPAVVDAYTADAVQDLGATLRALQAMAAAREPVALAPRLGEIRVPVALLVGGRPHAGGPPPAELELLQRALPAFTLATLEDVGHFPHEERPAEVRDAFVGLFGRIVARPVHGIAPRQFRPVQAVGRGSNR